MKAEEPTLTAEQIKRDFSGSNEGKYDDVERRRRESRFSGWLAQHDKDVITKYEREQAAKNLRDRSDIADPEIYDFLIRYAIAMTNMSKNLFYETEAFYEKVRELGGADD